MDKNKVIIKDTTQQTRNVHLACHPFYYPDGIVMMIHRGDYGRCCHKEMSDYHKRLADTLWDSIPGLATLFFTNGNITLQHIGLYEDNEVIEEAEKIIRPFLEEILNLEQLFNSGQE